MIAFGSAVTRADVYRENAEVGIKLAAELDSRIYAQPSAGSIFSCYNALLDRAAAEERLEALVLVHQDAQIVDADFCRRARRALSDPAVGVVGCVGAVGVRSIAWWEGSVVLASFVHRYREHGGGDLAAFSWANDDAPPYARTGEVDAVDGFLLVVSPWVTRHIRFDESLGALHGYDFDFCLQVREAGKKVVTADFRAIHNHPLEPFADPEGWIQAHIKVAEKWDGRLPSIGFAPGSWQERALRAEAERDAAKIIDYSNRLEFAARIRQAEYARREAAESVSWRLTAPVRRIRQRAATRARRGGSPSSTRR